MVARLRNLESVTVKSRQIGEALIRDAFPSYRPENFRGRLSEAPDLRGTYDFHDPRVMPHHPDLPHFQIKTEAGDWIKVFVEE
jgi:hypothetical protein